MKIVSSRKIEDCFDGSTVFRYEASEPWTAENLCCLAPLGKLELFKDFPRLLFRLRTREGLFLSGVAGDVVFRVVLPRTGRDAAQRRLLALLQ